MAYVALYRSWRPQSFEDLVGQEPVKKALTNALETGRISHAYLFAGPRGTGKTSTARILAKALNCSKGPTAQPCNACSHCKEITEGTSADVIEIDAASNRGIEEMKKIREQVYFAPVSSRYKVYIIDEVHMVTPDAFNAILKTLEEPPEHVVFILATTEPQKILNTILSRCQRYDFHRVTVDEIAAHLQKVCDGSGIQAEPEALRLIAIQADGGMRDALSLLDQCSVMETLITPQTVRQVLGLVGRETLRTLIGNLGKKDLSAALENLNALLEQGREMEQILVELMEYFRALLLFSVDQDYQEIYLTDTAEHLAELGNLFTRPQIVANVERIHQAVQESKYSLRKKIVGELCLFDLCENRGDTEAALRAQVADLVQTVKALRQAAPGMVATPVPAKESAAQLVSDVARSNLLSQAALEEPTLKNVELARSQASPELDTAQLLAQIAGTEPATRKVPVAQADEDVQAPAITSPKMDVPLAIHGEGKVEGERLWEKVQQELEQERQRTFAVYAKMAYAVEYTGGSLILATRTKTSRDKFEQIRFHQTLLQILQRLTGQPATLEVLLEKDIKVEKSAAPKALVPRETVAENPVLVAPELKKVQEAQAPSKVSSTQVPETVKKAQQVFGGEIYKE